MAQAMQCDTECGTPAAIMVTMIATGDVQAYCAPCYEDITAELLGQTGRIAAIVDAAITAGVQAGELARQAAATKPRKGAAKKAAPAQDTASDGESTPGQTEQPQQ